MKTGFYARGNQIFQQMSLPSCCIFGTEKPPMKKLIAIFALVLGVVAAKAALPQPDLIAQIHFAGAQKISIDSSYLLFANEFSCAEAKALTSQTFDKLAQAPHDWFKTKIAANRGDGTAQLRPLFDDLLASEWYFEARDMATGSPEYALAIHLNSNRAELWRNNLQQLLEMWTGIPARKVPGGWELKKDLPPNLIRVTENDGWLLVDCGQNQLSLGGKIFQWLAQDANSGSSWTSGEKKWLFADVNWVRLAQWFPELKELNVPETKFGVSAQGKNLHIDGKFIFPENFSSNLPGWQIPANMINQPFVSFTAARGFAPWLNTQAWARPFEISPALDQIFVWAMPKIPFETFAAFPVLNSADALAQSYARLNLALISADNQNEFLAPFRIAMINNEIQFQGLPFIAPHLQAVREPAGQFLLAGGFANPPPSAPLPQDLFKIMATKDLVFYHWEITAERFPQLLNMTQLGLLLTQHQQLGATSAAMKWLQKVTPNLGNTATEIFRTAPDELTFTRSAPGGLTALEFLVLGNWLEANNFPGCNLKLPPDQMIGNPAPRPIRTINTPAPAH
jgi:hypothetical protein